MPTKGKLRSARTPWGLSTLRTVCLLALTLSAGSAKGLSVWLADEDGFGFHDNPLYARNEMIVVSGEWDRFDFPCPIGDLYLVPNGYYRSTDTAIIDRFLTRKPVQGCGFSGGFWGAILKLPLLPLGEFDIIMDENQDGRFDPGVDLLMGDGELFALTVVDQTLDQVVDVAGIKAEAGLEAQHWIRTGRMTKASLAAASMVGLAGKAAELAVIASSPAAGFGYAVYGVAAGAFLSSATSYNGAILSVGSRMLSDACTATASVYQALHDDPPDPDYLPSVTLPPVLYAQAETGDPVAAATIDLSNNLAEQSALGAGYRRAYEKFLGAEAAADYGPALRQTRSARSFCGLLQETLVLCGSRLDELESAVAARGWADTVFAADAARALQQRVISSGFTAAELVDMARAGMVEAEIDSARVAIQTQDLTNLTDSSWRALITELRVRASIAAAECDSVSADLDTVLAGLMQVFVPQPQAVITAPDTVSEGTIVTLNGSASSEPRHGALSYAWDLDMDGIFEDGAAATADWHPTRESHRLVALRVESSDGNSDIAYRRVVVRNVNRSPSIVSAAPESLYVVRQEGSSVDFAVGVADPDGDAISAGWRLDGVDAGSGFSHSWCASGAGLHHLQARLSDGSGLSPDVIHTWRIRVVPASSDITLPGFSGGAVVLGPNHPNPFNPTTTIPFNLENATSVHLCVYDAAGRFVRALERGSVLQAGRHEVTWNGLDEHGQAAASGTYFCRLRTSGKELAIRMVLIR